MRLKGLWRQNITPVVLLLLALSSTSVSASDEELVVRTNKGLVRGLTLTASTGRQVDAWLGIPFAQPPLGPLRFRHPQSVHVWEGIRDTQQLPNSCWQAVDEFYGDFSGSAMWNPNTPRSEDCLYLNVVRPRPRSVRPYSVMLWIFGGGFYSGSSTLDAYDPKILASQEDVIVVSFQYRVASLGYLYLKSSDTPGNAGMFDQLMALQWVKDNIASFGGNPDNITLFGESAGAASVGMHLLSPLSRPLFNQAILQSGSPTNPWAVINRREAAIRALRLAEAVKCPTSPLGDVIACLRRTDPEVLVNSEGFTSGFCEFAFVPIVDGSFLPEHPEEAMQAGNFKPTNLLVGSNSDEGYFYLTYFLNDYFGLRENPRVTRQMFLEAIPQLHARHTTVARSAIAYEYTDWLNAADSSANREAIDEMAGDRQFTCGVHLMAERYAATGNRVYVYYFSQRSSVTPWPRYMGALHGDEIMFVFGAPLNPGKRYSAPDIKLSRKMMRYWANFAKTGDPNGGPTLQYGADFWPPHKIGERKYMTLSSNSSAVKVGPKLRRCAFWNRFLPQLNTSTGEIGSSSDEKCTSSSPSLSTRHTVVRTCIFALIVYTRATMAING